MKNLRQILTSTSFMLLLLGCSPRAGHLKDSAQNYIDNKQYGHAVEIIDKIIGQRNGDKIYFWALHEGVQISITELKDYKRALRYLDAILIDAENFDDVIDAQKKKAEIYFNNFQNYPEAIIEYGKVNLIAKDETDKVESQLFVARSYYYLSDFKNAEIVIGTVLKMKPNADQTFYTNQLLGNTKLAEKDYKAAEEIFLRLLKQFPDKSTSENIFLNLAVVYEENNQIDKAIDLLNAYKNKYNPKDYIDLRIRRLMARKKNMPGAKGLKK